ncbi:MAG: pyridoxamine 5'-phosphate oxidase [Saprospiraceae bacterium]|nr:pyridoxamine 5'-phosphate oxidase [Saprospiraceae bacterium]
MGSTYQPLIEAEAPDSPFRLYESWYQEATNVEGELLANAMTLATVDEMGKPSARLVMLKGFTVEGFVFYTNFHSRKGHDLARNAQAALVFWWPTLARQVRMQGEVHNYDPVKSTDFFQNRPRPYQVGAWASPQSQIVPDVEYLEDRVRDVETKYPEGNLPRPPHWGGYQLIPDRMEFWQGKDNHLHDRLEYIRLETGDWELQRLAP